MMHRVAWCALLVGATLLLAACDQAQPESSTFAPSATASAEAAVEPIDGSYVAWVRSGRWDDVIAQVEAAGGEVAFRHDPTGTLVVRGLSAEAAAALGASGLVADLIQDFVVPVDLPELAGEPVAADLQSPTNPAAATFYPRQWHLMTIQAAAAWNAGIFGSRDVTVAILDTGIDYRHADLEGLVDLARSASFVPQDDAVVATNFPGAHPIADLHYHGTHVAATVASNARAAAGVASNVTLTGIRVCAGRPGASGCPFGAIMSGVLHAADTGADIANMSLGGAFSRTGNSAAIAFINRVFDYARRQGTLVVVSAGNSAFNLDLRKTFFTSYCDAPGVMCISATGPTGRVGVNGPWFNIDNPASYTNFGRSSITVAAPGGNAGIGVTAACSGFSLALPVCQTGTFVLALSGTSMASPHVSGLAALLKSQNPGLTPARLSATIQQTADDLGPRGVDAFYGRGRINVARALGL